MQLLLNSLQYINLHWDLQQFKNILPYRVTRELETPVEIV